MRSVDDNVLNLSRTLFTERWRHLTYESNLINNEQLVAKEYFHFKLSNVTKRANLYGIVLFPLYVVYCDVTFVIVPMRLCGQRNTFPK